MDKSKIAKYYDSISYRSFCAYRTKNLKDVRVNTNKILAEIARINCDTRVLDVGCGIGSSSAWLAENIGANIVGITLSTKEKEAASSLAKKRGVSHLTEFYIKDFLQTGFPDNAFDVVWAIESVCYADDKKDFLMEAYRVLKKGGKIVIADGFLNREVRNSEQYIYEEFLKNLLLPNLALFRDFEKSMDEVGFSNIRIWNETKQTKKYSVWDSTFKIAEVLQSVSGSLMSEQESKATRYNLIKIGLCGFGIFYGEKS